MTDYHRPYLCPDCGRTTSCWCGGCHWCDDGLPEDYDDPD